jgi:hypothetical protein
MYEHNDIYDEWEELLEYGINNSEKDYYKQLEYFIGECKNTYDVFELQGFSDIFLDARNSFDVFSIHYKLGILASIKTENHQFLEFYLSYLQRDLEIYEIRMGLRFEDGCTAEDLDYLEIDEIDIKSYNELKPLYESSRKLL